MNAEKLAEIAGNEFWVEYGDKALKVGVVMNLKPERVEADLSSLRTKLKAAGFNSRFASRGVYRQLRVWT